MFKVALVGTHGVGKTTVAYELGGAIKRRGRTVELLTEIAREHSSAEIEWDGKDEYGDKLGRGVYLYILRITTGDKKKKEVIGK